MYFYRYRQHEDELASIPEVAQTASCKSPQVSPPPLSPLGYSPAFKCIEMNSIYYEILHLTLSRSHDDHWGATDSPSVSLQLTLFSDSLRVFQNLNPVQSKMLFPSRYFAFLCLSFFALFLVRMRGHRGFLLEAQSHAGMFSPRAANPT